MRILIVDDNEASLQSLSMVLSDLGHEPQGVLSADAALRRLDAEHFPLVITDIRMPGMDGLELLGQLKERPRGPAQDVVIITGHGDMETAIEALRKGAYDYLNKPINARELAAVVERSAEHLSLLLENQEYEQQFSSKVDEATREIRENLERVRDRLRVVEGVGEVVAESEGMRAVLAETAIYHDDASVPVLIEGETGTGKEVVAKLIHHGEHGSAEPFVAINCSAIPATLFEAELFGHEAGAYTGSNRRGAQGKLEVVGQGTLFLDEIAEMPLSLQPKLLRVLEDRTFYRVGGIKKREIHGRIVCAANKPLERMVEEGLFRRDLFHRLKVGYLRLPPLRERPEDVEALARSFLAREARRKNKPFADLHPDALRLLRAHPWPGNVRELENAIERAVLTRSDHVLRPGHLDFLTASPGLEYEAPPLDRPLGVEDLPEERLDLEELTNTLIRLALEKYGGNKSLAARYLGISRYALHRRLNKS